MMTGLMNASSVIVVLQARMNSARLPGKILLPVGGYPLVVLAAKRASNTGLPVVVVTSTEPSDDVLAQTLEEFKVDCFRGSLHNVLKRTVDALGQLAPDTVVIRLTADNVIPDGKLIDEMLAQYIYLKPGYFCCGGPGSGLPYGVSIEITRLRCLREAAAHVSSSYDTEHVTPYVRRKYGVKIFEKYHNFGLEHLRCTVDCLDDFLSVQQLFSTFSDSVHAPLENLLENLKANSSKNNIGKSCPKLVLGTAQLGGDYGIANNFGQPSFSTAQAIVKTAISNGVAYIDTARAYGESEAVIGQVLSEGWRGRVKIITKLSPMNQCPADATKEVVQAFVDASVFRSLAALRSQKVDVLMLHRVEHLDNWEGTVWQRLADHVKEGRIGALGVSVQTPEDLNRVLDVDAVAYIQMPFNILDWRWSPIIAKLTEVRAKRKIVIHARSCLLQGLLLSDDADLWGRAHINDHEHYRDWLASLCERFSRNSVADLCIAYLNATPWIDGVAIGVEIEGQILENLELFRLPPLSQTQLAEAVASRPKVLAATLNPAEWKV